ncbi:glycosyltransferase [Bacteroides eggerthii]|uniref:glycosyltransferase n=1 Tax=Bacteroides eggerthii TaxID=28111 RepID=UPI00374D219F
MDIVFTIDEKFTRFCAVAIASLLKHNKTEEICFHIVTDNLTEKSKTKWRLHLFLPCTQRKNRRLSSKSHEPPYFIGYFLSLHAAFTAPLAAIQSNLP